MKEIELTQGYKAIVDEEDYDRVNVFKWHMIKSSKFAINGLVYARRTIVFPRVNGKQPQIQEYLHRYILNNFDKSVKIDFKDDNPLNCQKENFIISNNACKSHNATPRIRQTAKGVRKKYNKWHARISANKKDTFIGTFDTEQEAFDAYCKKNLELQRERGAKF
jgi:hypothetical protein